MQPTMPPSRQTGRTRSVAAGEPVNLLEHALHSSKVLTKSKSARFWSAREENKIHEAHVMQAKEPGGVSFNWSEKNNEKFPRLSSREAARENHWTECKAQKRVVY